MKHLLLFLIPFAIAFTSCKKRDKEVEPEPIVVDTNYFNVDNKKFKTPNMIQENLGGTINYQDIDITFSNFTFEGNDYYSNGTDSLYQSVYIDLNCGQGAPEVQEGTYEYSTVRIPFTFVDVEVGYNYKINDSDLSLNYSAAKEYKTVKSGTLKIEKDKTSKEFIVSYNFVFNVNGEEKVVSGKYKGLLTKN